MAQYSNDVPASAVRRATTGPELKKWKVYCDRDRPSRLAAVMRWKQTDWYMCTLKNAAVRTDLRGKGIGGKLYPETAKQALKSDTCLVLAADVDYDNIPSIRLLEKIGFEPVNRFCWGRGAKPADILHFVKIPTEGDTC